MGWVQRWVDPWEPWDCSASTSWRELNDGIVRALSFSLFWVNQAFALSIKQNGSIEDRPLGSSAFESLVHPGARRFI